MHFNNLISSAAALTFAATKVAAVTHGEETDFNGAPVKWQQIGKGIWTGIPVDEWDDESEHFYTVLNIRCRLT